MPDISAFAYELIFSLVMDVILACTKCGALPFLRRRRIEARVEEATAQVVEPLLPFLAHEGISEEKRRLLIRTCVDELRPVIANPKVLFEASLDGQKLFDRKYGDTALPQTITDEGLGNVYALLFPRIATLVCRIPAAVKDWESNAWAEGYRRLDEIAAELGRLFQKVDSLGGQLTRSGAGVLPILRRALAQRIGMDLDLTGLRADRPLIGKFDDFFVHPSIARRVQDKEVALATKEQSFRYFLQARRRAIISGDPGSGKSTWSQWLQREALTDGWTGLPVRVELRSLPVQSLPSLHDVVGKTVSVHLAADVTSHRVREWIEESRLVFVLDGFDEIAPTARDRVLKWVNELEIAIGPCGLIVTSRPLTTKHLDNLPKAWERWHIESFDEPRIVDYIGRWYAHAPLLANGERRVHPATLAAEWRRDPAVHPLTANPLLLSTLLTVHHLDGKLPSSRSELYRRYVDGMLGVWDDRRKVTATDVRLSPDEKRRVIRALALHLQFAQKDVVDEAEAVDAVKRALANMGKRNDAAQVLAALRERSGLIIGPGIYGFVHKTVGEFLVAEAIVQGNERESSGRRIDRFCLFEHRGDDRWNTVIFLWAGLAPVSDVESFVDECMRVSDVTLGLGILLDQYERFSLETRRNLLLPVLQNKWKMPFRRDVYFYTRGHAVSDLPQPKGVEIPYCSLRGLTGSVSHPLGTSLHALLCRALADGTVVWSDAHGTRNPLRDLVWTSAAMTTSDVGAWRECIRAKPPKSGAAADWLYWVAECLMRHLLVEQEGAGQIPFLDAYEQNLPLQKGILAIALMSATAELWGRNEAWPEEARIGTQGLAKRSMSVLARVGRYGVPPDLLADTRRWSLPPIRKPCDLLATYRQVLISSYAEDVEQPDQATRDAIAYVEGLIQERDKVS